jgi:hypothetical protein
MGVRAYPCFKVLSSAQGDPDPAGFINPEFKTDLKVRILNPFGIRFNVAPMFFLRLKSH